jgi:hypothetical protein
MTETCRANGPSLANHTNEIPARFPAENPIDGMLGNHRQMP